LNAAMMTVTGITGSCCFSGGDPAPGHGHETDDEPGQHGDQNDYDPAAHRRQIRADVGCPSLRNPHREGGPSECIDQGEQQFEPRREVEPPPSVVPIASGREDRQRLGRRHHAVGHGRGLDGHAQVRHFYGLKGRAVLRSRQARGLTRQQFGHIPLLLDGHCWSSTPDSRRPTAASRLVIAPLTGWSIHRFPLSTQTEGAYLTPKEAPPSYRWSATAPGAVCREADGVAQNLTIPKGVVDWHRCAAQVGDNGLVAEEKQHLKARLSGAGTSLVDRARTRGSQTREARPWLHRIVSAYERYLRRSVGRQASVVTYVAYFLAFPLLVVYLIVIEAVLTASPRAAQAPPTCWILSNSATSQTWSAQLQTVPSTLLGFVSYRSDYRSGRHSTNPCRNGLEFGTTSPTQSAGGTGAGLLGWHLAGRDAAGVLGAGPHELTRRRGRHQ
jgi:hypothetical protein